MEVKVLRYGHRIERDKRVTTHCCLVARAFGAGSIAIFGDVDKKLFENLQKFIAHWGGDFKVEFKDSWEKECRELKKSGYKIVHLTMYGLPLEKEAEKLRKEKKLAVFIGSQKVPPQMYGLADYNISVTNQPHSEIAALALVLDRLFKGKELSNKFKGAKIRITPSSRIKIIDRT